MASQRGVSITSIVKVAVDMWSSSVKYMLCFPVK
jgi:hypothetical protein